MTGSDRSKPSKTWRISSFLLGVRESCFSLDLYGYTPSLIVSEYKTFISLLTSFIILSAFSLAVIYTSYIWVVGNLNQTEADEVHDESLSMLPGSALNSFGDMPLPQFGVVLLLGNGSFVNWENNSSAFKVFFQQSVVCHSDAANKLLDILPQDPCSFEGSPGITIAGLNVTRCASWEAASSSLAALGNTASNPCKVPQDPGEQYSVPRVVGTFYNQEYSYITATVAVNSSLLTTALINIIAKGSMQVLISFNYFSPSNFAQGIVQPVHNRVWSRRVNLFPNVAIKAEVLMRPRKITIHNYWWDVPSLERPIVDYLPYSVETYTSLAGNVVPGWTDIGKVYLRFDDRDLVMDLYPPQDALAVLSGWGGFLSILLVVGTPAVVINRLIFQHKIKKLIFEDKITFDEGVRTNRSQAVTKSYVQGGGKSIMTKTRRTSVFGFLGTGSQTLLPAFGRTSGTPPSESDPLPTKEVRKAKLSFLDPDMSHSSPSLLQSPDGQRPRAKSHLSYHTSMSFPNVPSSTPPPTPSFLGGFKGGKVHAESSPQSDDTAPAAPADEPLSTPSSTPERTSDDTTVFALAADTAPPPADPSGTAASPAPDQPSLLDPGTAVDDTAVLIPAAPDTEQQAQAAAATPLGESTENPAFFPRGPDYQHKRHSLGPGRMPDDSAYELMEQGWGAARPGPSRRFFQGTQPNRSSAAAPLPLAAAYGHHTWDQAGPDVGGSRGVCEHNEASGTWSHELPGGYQGRTFRMDDDTEIPGTAAGPDNQVASMAVLYEGDCFADDDEDENYEDVVRHATSECNALFHLRQVVKLVQRDSPFLTLWGDNLTVHQQQVTKQKHDRSVRKISRPASRTEAAPFLPHTASEPRDGAYGEQEQELSTRSSPQGAEGSTRTDARQELGVNAGDAMASPAGLEVNEVRGFHAGGQ